MNVFNTTLDAVSVLTDFYCIPALTHWHRLAHEWIVLHLSQWQNNCIYHCDWWTVRNFRKLSLLFVFQRGDQGAARSAGGGRGSGGSALRGAATAGGELHHPLRYAVSLETLGATKLHIKIPTYTTYTNRRGDLRPLPVCFQSASQGHYKQRFVHM